MKTDKKEIIVEGKPKGKGRPRLTTIGGHAHAYTPKATAEYEKNILNAFINKYGNFKYSENDYLEMTITAYMPIPSSFNKKQQQDAVDNILKPATRTSDIDNILKSAMDALQGEGRPIPDDKQIIKVQAEKCYSKAPKLLITLDNI